MSDRIVTPLRNAMTAAHGLDGLGAEHDIGLEIVLRANSLLGSRLGVIE